MIKPTPGEWKYGVRPDKSIWLSLGDVKGPGAHFQGDLVASEDDARLMVASRELLEALKLCSSILAGETLSKSELVRALEASRAAMIKAGCTP